MADREFKISAILEYLLSGSEKITEYAESLKETSERLGEHAQAETRAATASEAAAATQQEAAATATRAAEDQVNAAQATENAALDLLRAARSATEAAQQQVRAAGEGDEAARRTLAAAEEQQRAARVAVDAASQQRTAAQELLEAARQEMSAAETAAAAASKGEQSGSRWAELGTSLSTASMAMQQVGSSLLQFGQKAAEGMEELIEKGVEAEASLAHLSEKTGASVESLSSMRLAAQESGVSIEQLGTAMGRMARTIDNAAQGSSKAEEALTRLGLSHAALMAMKPEDQFAAIAEALSKQENATQRVALAQGVFGRAGAELLPLLMKGKAGIEEYTEKARELGMVVSGEASESALHFENSMKEAGDAVLSVKTRIAEALMPVLQPLIETFTSIAESVGKWVQQNPGLARVAAAVVAVSVAVVALGGVLLVAAGAFTMFAGALTSGMAAIEGAGGVLALMSGVMTAIRVGFLAAIPAVISFFTSLWASLAPILPIILLISAACGLVVVILVAIAANWRTIKEACEDAGIAVEHYRRLLTGGDVAGFDAGTVTWKAQRAAKDAADDAKAKRDEEETEKAKHPEEMVKASMAAVDEQTADSQKKMNEKDLADKSRDLDNEKARLQLSKADYDRYQADQQVKDLKDKGASPELLAKAQEVQQLRYAEIASDEAKKLAEEQKKAAEEAARAGAAEKRKQDEETRKQDEAAKKAIRAEDAAGRAEADAMKARTDKWGKERIDAGDKADRLADEGADNASVHDFITSRKAEIDRDQAAAAAAERQKHIHQEQRQSEIDARSTGFSGSRTLHIVHIHTDGRLSDEHVNQKIFEFATGLQGAVITGGG